MSEENSRQPERAELKTFEQRIKGKPVREYWNNYPEFKAEIKKRLEQGIPVDDKERLGIMQSIYQREFLRDKKLKENGEAGIPEEEFCFRKACRETYELARKVNFYPVSEDGNGIGFLYHKLGIPKYNLTCWMTVPAFVQEIKKAMKKGKKFNIDHAFVLGVMQEIYKQESKTKDIGLITGFQFHHTKKSMKQLAEILYGDREKWLEE